MTTRKVAQFLGLSPETVLRRWRRGELPGYRLASNVLRFRGSDLETWLLSHRMGGGFGSVSEKTPRQQGFREVGRYWARTSTPTLATDGHVWSVRTEPARLPLIQAVNRVRRGHWGHSLRKASVDEMWTAAPGTVRVISAKDRRAVNR
jgi:excisionase family DNA binding protein